MARLSDLERKGALSVLAGLIEKEPMAMDGFTSASGMTWDGAVRLRADLALLGYIRVEEKPVRGAYKDIQIWLTPMGREIAEVAVKLKALLEAAKDAKRSKVER